MFNIIKDKSKLYCNVIKYCNAKYFKNNNYLEIFIFKLFLSIIVNCVKLEKFLVKGKPFLKMYYHKIFVK